METDRRPASIPWGALVALAAIAALAGKLALAACTAGTVDVAYWKGFLADITASGGDVYLRNELFNHPPATIHLLRALGALAAWTNVPFPFWLRLPGILADVGTVALVWRLRDRLAPLPVHPIAIVLLALAPAALMISGYHGNTDSLMIFFVVLAAFLAERHAAGWPAGAAIGMAMCVKLPAAIFLPALVLSRRPWPRRVALVAAAATTIGLASLPYLRGHVAVIAQRVLGYGGGKTPWGAPLLADLVRARAQDLLVAGQPPIDPAALIWLYRLASQTHAVYEAWSRPVLIGALCLAAWWMNRPARRLPLFSQCAITTALFLFLAPGFGVQYLAWIVPWVAAAGALPAALFHLASGALLYWLYRTDYFGWPTAWERSLLCWITVGIVLGACLWRAPAGGRGRRAALALAAGALVALVGVALSRALREGSGGRPLVVASSTLDGYSTAAVVDGRGEASGHGWQSAGTPSAAVPETLTFFFPRPRSIGHIDLAAYPDPRFTLTSFIFQLASADGWRDIEATRVTGNTVATAWSFTVPRLETRLVRLRIDGAAAAAALVLEVRFGDASAAPPTPLTPP